jgi:hypothetical protein
MVGSFVQPEPQQFYAMPQYQQVQGGQYVQHQQQVVYSPSRVERVIEPEPAEVEQDAQLLEEAPVLYETSRQWLANEIREVTAEAVIEESPAGELYVNRDQWRAKWGQVVEAPKLQINQACDEYLQSVTALVNETRQQLLDEVDLAAQRGQELFDLWLQDVDSFAEKTRDILRDERGRLVSKVTTTFENVETNTLREETQLVEREATNADFNRAASILRGIREGAQIDTNAQYIVDLYSGEVAIVDQQALAALFSGLPEVRAEGVVDAEACAGQREEPVDLVPVTTVIEERTQPRTEYVQPPVQYALVPIPAQQQQVIQHQPVTTSVTESVVLSPAGKARLRQQDAQ